MEQEQKQIYFYWGNQKLSFLRYMTIKSFSFFNPDWEINIVKNNKIASKNLWITVEEQDNESYNGHDYREELFNIKKLNIIDIENIFPVDYSNMSNVHIKDMINWYLLSSRSCVVADMDILFTKSITTNTSIDWDSNVNICNYDFHKNYIPVSLMISKVKDNGKNDFYQDVYNNCIKKYDPKVYESCGTNSIPYKSIYDIIENYKELKINKMDEESVFPFIKINMNHMNYIFEQNSLHILTPNTIGIHWYGGKPVSQKYNNMVNHTNYMNYNNTICNIIKKIMN